MPISNMLWKPLTEWFWVLGHIILQATYMPISNMLWKPLTEWFWVLGHIILQATYPCYQYIKGKSTVEEKRNI